MTVCYAMTLQPGGTVMHCLRILRSGLVGLVAAAATAFPAFAQQQSKPNILFIMGDDMGGIQPITSHKGLRVGKPPNIARIGQEGPNLMDHGAIQTCPSGRNPFFTGMSPLPTGMIPPQLPGSPSYL